MIKSFKGTACALVMLSILPACSGDSYRKETVVRQNSNGDYVETTKVKGKPAADAPVYQAAPSSGYSDQDQVVNRRTTRTEVIERQ